MSDNTVRKTSHDNRRVQTIMFVRHGVAKHNLRDPNTNLPLNLHDPSLLDPSLVLQGKQQALEAGDLIRQWFRTQNLDIELVITSPLTRCLQTTSLAFLPGEEYCFDRQEPKIMVMDQIREAYGMHYPDKRRDKSLLMVSEKGETETSIAPFLHSIHWIIITHTILYYLINFIISFSFHTKHIHTTNNL